MLKKILFFSITLIVGIVVAYTTYFSNYINFIYDTINTAVEEEKYENVVQLFTSYFDTESAIDSVNTENGFINVYPSIIYTTSTDENGSAVTVFEKAYSIYAFNLKSESFAALVDQKNLSGFALYNGTTKYEYSFVVTEGDNIYDFAEFIQTTGLMQLDLSYSVVEKSLNSAITKIELVDNQGKAVLSYDNLNLCFGEEFFTMADEYITNYSSYAEANDEAGWSTFYEGWKTRFDAEGSYLAYDSTTINMKSVLWKTVGMLALYIVACFLVGILIFKGGKLFARNKSNTRYQRRPQMKGNVSKQNVKPTVKAEVVEQKQIENKVENE